MSPKWRLLRAWSVSRGTQFLDRSECTKSVNECLNVKCYIQNYAILNTPSVCFYNINLMKKNNRILLFSIILKVQFENCVYNSVLFFLKRAVLMDKM